MVVPQLSDDVDHLATTVDGKHFDDNILECVAHTTKAKDEIHGQTFSAVAKEVLIDIVLEGMVLIVQDDQREHYVVHDHRHNQHPSTGDTGALEATVVTHKVSQPEDCLEANQPVEMNIVVVVTIELRVLVSSLCFLPLDVLHHLGADSVHR